MNPGAVRAIVHKDLTAFRRDRFFVFITLLGLVAYVAVFWLLPSDVDETVTVGVSLDGAPGPELSLGEGLDVAAYGSRDALADAVADGDEIAAGIAFPPGFRSDVAAGRETTVELLVSARMPEEMRFLMEGMVDRVAAIAAGGVPLVDPIAHAVVLGPDRVGDQVSFQEQIRPLLAFLILIVETFALATLVAAEIQERTVTAVLVTPATPLDFLAAKGILGTGLAFTEAVLLMALIGGFAGHAAIVAVTLLFGAVLVTGFGMVAGTIGKDFLSVLFWSLALMVPLTVPAFGVLFPGTASGWTTLLPTHPLVDTIVRVTTENAGWGEVGPSLGLLAGWCAVCFVGGAYVLKRRVATL